MRQVLTVGTSTGCVFNYLMSLTSLAAGHVNKMCYLSSLREVTVTTVAQMGGLALTSSAAVSAGGGGGGLGAGAAGSGGGAAAAIAALATEHAQAAPLVIPVALEPGFVACGPAHAAVGMNNRVWYYGASASAAAAGSTRVGELVAEHEYVGSVRSGTLWWSGQMQAFTVTNIGALF